MTQASSSKANLSHEERTATEPRASDLHPVILKEITKVNERIQTYRFVTKNKKGIKFLAGQWLDVYVPGIEKAGGFTITSAPQHAVNYIGETHETYLELAIQKSPDNPPAAWLWQPPERIIGTEIYVRVGGSFVWPPNNLRLDSIDHVVLIAGGVGINPLIAILSHLRQHGNPPSEVSLFYSTKLPSADPESSEVLFLPRILDAYETSASTEAEGLKGQLELFFTGSWENAPVSPNNGLLRSLQSRDKAKYKRAIIEAQIGRIDEAALKRALGDHHQRQSSVFYVCGPPEMTDSIVEYLGKQDNVSPDRVLCEKWW
ncbi:hypothetical protein B0J11DRAFT_586667 [Dendryphion nanum]|uniref:FAD-binding FR-type domain-containing protein n=1 Tax=Dendryphion nanum TaxID=256645 RepID=A0A9P9CYA5_9PLEO|nr:hypothetical protein B0J11DRAFT_586667 [Dendryphion nanum]